MSQGVAYIVHFKILALYFFFKPQQLNDSVLQKAYIYILYPVQNIHEQSKNQLQRQMMYNSRYLL